jgi:UDP-N-acetylmuramyl pentapeptide phosphotransferase/UDP-N-acetylglucosamine-1-phosphate transferase
MAVQIGLLVAASAAVGLAVAWLTGPLREALIRRGVYDAPNARSLHAEKKPRGGGLAILAVVLPCWLVADWTLGLDVSVPAAALFCVGLAAVSVVDDIRGLPAVTRLGAQTAAVGAGMAFLVDGSVFQGLLPPWLDALAAGFAWLWFVNLYNFMDGIDGITGVETATVGFGLGLVALLTGSGVADAVLPWLLAGAAVGFLWWNWAPSKIFLGDVGSVTLGFALGWLLLHSAAQGQWAAALILPAYYLADATITLLRRLARLEKVWQAHRSHAYQRAVQAGLGHAGVAARIACANVVLIACAVLAAVGHPVPAVVVAALVVAALWHAMVGRRPASA